MQKHVRSALMIKVGGSTLDAEFESNQALVSKSISPIKDLRHDYDLFITTGGGPAWDVRKQWRKRYGTPIDEFKEIAQLNLQMNAKELVTVFGHWATVCKPDEFNPLLFASMSDNQIIRICYWPPASFITSPEQSVQSDLQTLLMAEALAQVYAKVDVIFVKRTAGIYAFDPRLSGSKIKAIISNKRCAINIKARYNQLYRDIEKARDNNSPLELNRLPLVTTSDMLTGGISRLGEDGDDDHLIERSAITFLHDKQRKINTVGIIHYLHTHLIQEMITAPSETSPYSFIVRG